MRFAGLIGALTVCAFGAGPALSACSASNTYNFAFSSQANSSLSYAGNYTYTASNGLGANRNFTVGFATYNLSSSQAGGVQMPAIGSLITSASGAKTLTVGGIFTGRTGSITANSRVIRVTFAFAVPIRDLTLSVHDIDFADDQYRDWLHVQGSNGASSYVPAMVSPFATNNGAGPYANNGSALRFGPSSGNGVSVANASQAVGVDGSANNNVADGDISISFAQPVTSVTLRYGNFPYVSGENSTGQQAFGISALSFCPMPNLATSTKTSAPFATTGPTRFNAPLSDVVYTLTVSNSGGSPVDLGGIVLTDTLPPTLQFYNGDFDPAAAGTEPFQLNAGSSGVTLGSANVTYSNNGGSSYGYTPAAGYDPNVNRIRFSPGGTLAANSSFDIRFRARIR
ncbi:MAG: hypothetical protein WBR13_00450 [Allosphingosinicella sp.]